MHFLCIYEMQREYFCGPSTPMTFLSATENPLSRHQAHPRWLGEEEALGWEPEHRLHLWGPFCSHL